MTKVKDILNLSDMKCGIVRAGKKGLDRQIRWVHVIDHEDLGNFLEGEEFLLASGQIWPKNTQIAEQLLNTLLVKRISGIVFATGRYLMEVPKEALEFGEKHSIPIVEVPFHISFVKVTRTIHETILNNYQNSSQSSDPIPIELIEKIKSVETITDICRLLSIHLNSYVFITDPQNRVLTKSIPNDVKHIKNSTIINKLRDTLEIESYSQLNEKTSLFEPNQATFVPSKNPPYSLFVPLQINENSQFTFWIFDPYHPLGQGDKKIAEYAAIVLKDSILNEKEAMVELTKRRLEFLELLLEGSMDNLPKIENKAREFGLYPLSNWIVGLLLLSDECTVEEIVSLRDHCQKWLDDSPEISGFCEKHGDELIIFVSLNKDSSDYKSQFYNLYYHLKNVTSKKDLILIISNLQQELTSFLKAYNEMKTVFSIVLSKRNRDAIYFAEQLQRELLLYGNLDPEQARAIQNLILPIELLSEKGYFLYETLKHLAEYGFNREQVAKVMHIHRNTLRYRIKRLEKLLNDDLSSAKCQFWIQVALDLEVIARKPHLK